MNSGPRLRFPTARLLDDFLNVLGLPLDFLKELGLQSAQNVRPIEKAPPYQRSRDL
jgi:hypothetical protein